MQPDFFVLNSLKSKNVFLKDVSLNMSVYMIIFCVLVKPLVADQLLPIMAMLCYPLKKYSRGRNSQYFSLGCVNQFKKDLSNMTEIEKTKYIMPTT